VVNSQAPRNDEFLEYSAPLIFIHSSFFTFPFHFRILCISRFRLTLSWLAMTSMVIAFYRFSEEDEAK